MAHKDITLLCYHHADDTFEVFASQDCYGHEVVLFGQRVGTREEADALMQVLHANVWPEEPAHAYSCPERRLSACTTDELVAGAYDGGPITEVGVNLSR